MSSTNHELGPANVAPSKAESSKSRWRKATALGAATIALVSQSGVIKSGDTAQASSDKAPIVVGGFDSIGEQLNPNVATNVVSKIRKVGFGELKEQVSWVSGQTKMSPADEMAFKNSYEAASENNMGVIAIFIPHTWKPALSKLPRQPNQQKNFCGLVSNVVKEFPDIEAVQIGNEENNPFFWPEQFKPDGTDNVAATYEHLLARCYDAVKAIDPNVEVIGGGLSPRGNDDPHSKRPSHSPTAFIANLGEAYRASGRTKPIMDSFGLHPYLDIKNGETISTTHPAPNTTIEAADYPKLVDDLSQAFDFPGSGQEGADLSIIYDEFAEEVPESGNNPAPGEVSASRQAKDYSDLLRMARCEQPTVKGVIFFKIISNSDWKAGMYDTKGDRTSNFYQIHNAVEDAQDSSAAC